MTERHAGYLITLEDDIREDDAEHVINALRMIKGVMRVEPIVANIELHIAQERAKHELQQRMREVLWR